MTFKHDFAISFAGEVREVAEKIAELLKKKEVKIYYDRYSEAEMLGKKLSTYFHKKYGADTRYVIILISKEYPNKDWTNLELSIARDEAKKRKEDFILPIRLDDTKILGIHDDIGFIDLRKKSIQGTVNILLKKLKLEYPDEDNKTKIEITNEKYLKNQARELLSKVNKISINISEILPEYLDLLIKIDENEEKIWVEAELSGDIYDVGKHDPNFFDYRGIKGYLSPYKLASSGFYNFDMLIADPKYEMVPFNYIPSISIFELEKNANDSDKIGIITFNQEAIKMLGLNKINISKIYFYFKPSDIIHIISNIKQKISKFLLKIIKNKL